MDRASATGYDRGMWALERSGIRGLRAALLNGLRGDVLEIGTGTGANLGLFPPETRVAAIDLRPAHLRAAAEKHLVSSDRGLLSCANAEQLPFPDGHFDAVVGTLVFCSIGRPAVALAEIQRVLQPGGQLRLIEHVRGQTRLTRFMTDTLHPAWFALQRECHLNRETAATVTEAGFRIRQTSMHWRGILQVILAEAP